MPSQVSYVDEHFWHKKFKEKDEKTREHTDKKFITKCFRKVPMPKTDYKTFAVKVKCVRADWIIKDMANGISFLQEMVRHKNKDVFNTDYAKIITQYLYKEYSGNLIK
jgi:hypothetical protein